MKKKKVDPGKSLSRFRIKIDAADRRLFEALAARFSAVEKIGEIKRVQGIPIVQAARWRELRKDRIKLGRELGLKKKFVGDLLELIHKESIKAQQRRKRQVSENETTDVESGELEESPIEASAGLS